MHLVLGILFVVGCLLVLYVKFAKVHVYTMFIAHYKILMQQGWRTGNAIKATIDNFRYRKPFSSLSESDLGNVVAVLTNLHNPAEVGCRVLTKDRISR